MIISVFVRVETIVGKGENGGKPFTIQQNCRLVIIENHFADAKINAAPFPCWRGRKHFESREKA